MAFTLGLTEGDSRWELLVLRLMAGIFKALLLAFLELLLLPSFTHAHVRACVRACIAVSMLQVAFVSQGKCLIFKQGQCCRVTKSFSK